MRARTTYQGRLILHFPQFWNAGGSHFIVMFYQSRWRRSNLHFSQLWNAGGFHNLAPTSNHTYLHFTHTYRVPPSNILPFFARYHRSLKNNCRKMVLYPLDKNNDNSVLNDNSGGGL